jgi:hypothetical protein
MAMGWGKHVTPMWSLITSDKQRPKPITKTHHDFSSHISLEGIALLSQLSRMRHQHAISMPSLSYRIHIPQLTSISMMIQHQPTSPCHLHISHVYTEAIHAL